RGREYWSGMILAGLACAGLLTSLGITRVPPAKPAARFRANPLGDLLDQIREIRRDRVLTLAVIGNTYFWFLGSLLLLNTVLYAKDILRVSDTASGSLLATLSLGIGLGSFVAGYLSGNKSEYDIFPLGSFCMTMLASFLGLPALSFKAVAILL